MKSEFKSLDDLYNKVTRNKETWDYYNDLNPLSGSYDFKEIINGSSSFYSKLIKELLGRSGKIAAQDMLKCVDELFKKEEEEKYDMDADKRLRHIVSLFFFGHVLYGNCDSIRKNVSRQLRTIGFPKTDDDARTFSFMWFLLCIFHDLGYAYEYNLIKDNQKMSLSAIEEIKPSNFLPLIYNEKNLLQYNHLRQCKWGVNDHGIWGGFSFYKNMLRVGKEIEEKQNEYNIKIFETENVEHIYQYAAWIIMCHNIFYNNGKDNYTDCYRCCGLDDFIQPKARCITLKNNPLLFLFCLADTLEPTKVLKSKSKNPQDDLKLCRLLKMDFGKSSIKFNLSGLSDYIVGEKYNNNIKGINDWLADVSDELVIKLK